MEVRYNDRGWSLIGIAFIAVFVRHLGDPAPLFNLLKNPEYYIDVVVNALIAFLVWQSNRRVILLLDRRYSWLKDTFKRFILQATLNLGISTILLIILIFIYNELIMHRSTGFNISYLFVIDVPMALVFVVLINMLYAGIYVVQHYEAQISHLKTELETALLARQVPPDVLPETARTEGEEKTDKPGKKNLLVNKGSSFVPLPTEEIAYIFRSDDFSFAKTFDSNEFLADYSLEQLSQMLSGHDFFRINRQMIVNLQAIRQVQNKENGSLHLVLKPPFTEEVTVSRRKAQEFKAWLDK